MNRFGFDFDYEDNMDDLRRELRNYKTYKYNCGDRTCGAPDCGSCRNGPPPWEEDEEEE